MSNNSAYLKAMGIDVWVEREPAADNNIDVEAGLSSAENQNAELPVETAVVKSLPVSTENIKVAEKKSTESKSAEPIVKINIEKLDWQALDESVSQCQSCALAKTRSQTVFGAGNKTAALMIIGDAPDEHDEQQGFPFSGKAGKLLTAMLKAMGYQRNDVYITNIVKCRAALNQEPSVEEAAACESYLMQQINLLQPKLILALGNVTAQCLLKNKSTLGRLRGQLHYIDNVNAPIIVSYHPAYLLRAPNEKRKAWEDLQMAMKQLNIAKAPVENKE